MNKSIAVCPGSFDPVTNGHIDIIKRGLKVFDRIVVAVLKNTSKTGMFSFEERLELLNAVFGENDRIEIDFFDGLLVDYMNKKKIKVIAKGLRAISDFEVEFQMALMNREVDLDIETIFLVPSVKFSFVNSRFVKEIYKMGGELKNIVPSIVDKKLKEKFNSIKQ